MAPPKKCPDELRERATRMAMEAYNSNQISDGTCYQIKLGSVSDRWKAVSESNC